MNPIAIVTGASRGIGRACALALAASAEPHDIAVHFHENAAAADATAAELRAKGVRAETFQANLSVAGQAALVEQVAERLGAPTVLIHCAGSIVEKPLSFTSPDELGRMLEVHALSAALLSQAMLRYVRKSERGRLIFIGSLAGEIGLGNASAYAAAKGALGGLCKSLALEAARWKTTVNIIAPGYVETDMTAPQDADRRKQLEATVPLGRYAKADEIAATAAFLCGPSAAYITGQTLIVDGGMSLG
jgi:3-oxoacyl-[acyl-carrier protein] reductase